MPTHLDRVWAAVESQLDRDPFGDNFNTAHEACTRYAGDPGRRALTVRHADGSSDRWTYQQLDRQEQLSPLESPFRSTESEMSGDHT